MAGRSPTGAASVAVHRQGRRWPALDRRVRFCTPPADAPDHRHGGRTCRTRGDSGIAVSQLTHSSHDSVLAPHRRRSAATGSTQQARVSVTAFHRRPSNRNCSPAMCAVGGPGRRRRLMGTPPRVYATRSGHPPESSAAPMPRFSRNMIAWRGDPTNRPRFSHRYRPGMINRRDLGAWRTFEHWTRCRARVATNAAADDGPDRPAVMVVVAGHRGVVERAAGGRGHVAALPSRVRLDAGTSACRRD